MTKIKVRQSTAAPYAAYDVLMHRGGHIYTIVMWLVNDSVSMIDLCAAIRRDQKRFHSSRKRPDPRNRIFS